MEELEKKLDHFWLSVYDEIEPNEYEAINEKEELLNGDDNNVKTS